MKGEAKLGLDDKKRKKKKESACATTGSETEKSSSHKTSKQVDVENLKGVKKDKMEKETKMKKQFNSECLKNREGSTEEEEEDDEENVLKNVTENDKSGDFANKEGKKNWKNDDGEKQMTSLSCEKYKDEFSGGEKNMADENQTIKKKKQLFSRLKAASTSRINLGNKSRGKVRGSCGNTAFKVRTRMRNNANILNF